MGQAVGRAAEGVSLESLQGKPGAGGCPPRTARTGHLRGPGRTATSPRRRRSPRKCVRSCARRCCSWWPRRRWCCSIACVSVGNLTLTRFTRRWRELQLRSALGATRTPHRIAAAGGERISRRRRCVAGAAARTARAAGADGLRAAQHEPSRRSWPDHRGCRSVRRPSPSSSWRWRRQCRCSSRRSGEGASGAAARRLRSGLVAGQVALSFVLMIAATLAVRSLLHLQGIDTGFTTVDVQTMRVDLNFSKYHDGRSIAVFWQEVERRLSATSWCGRRWRHGSGAAGRAAAGLVALYQSRAARQARIRRTRERAAAHAARQPAGRVARLLRGARPAGSERPVVRPGRHARRAAGGRHQRHARAPLVAGRRRRRAFAAHRRHAAGTRRRRGRERAAAARRAAGRGDLFFALPEQPAVDPLARPIEPARRRARRTVRAPLSRPWIRSSRSTTSARWNRSATICCCRPASRHRWSVSSPCWRW